MATRKTAETVKAEAEVPEVIQDTAAPEVDPRDAEIQRLKEELEKANKRAAYASPQEEQKRIHKLEEDAAAEGLDPWEIKVTVRVPRRPATEDPWYWMNINHRSVQIPANDRMQEMALPFAVTLMDMLAAEDRTKDFIDKEVKVYDPITNPKPTA